MYIHNIYSDLMVALTTHIDNQLPIRVKNVVFNIANVSFAFKKDTQYELPAAIVSLDSILPYIDHPYVFQFNTTIENFNKQLAIYDYDKDFAVHIQEEYQTLNISLNINCESQIQGFENQRSLIANLPIGKFMNFFKFTSFLELDRPLLNKYLIDVSKDRIDNLFIRHNKITNNTEYVFPMEYSPLVKMNSCDLMVSDINASSFQIMCSFEILFPTPMYQVYPCISYLIDINSFDSLPSTIISKPKLTIPIDTKDVVYNDVSDPYSNDKITSTDKLKTYLFSIPVIIKVVCFNSSSPDKFNFIDNIFIKSDYTFEKPIIIVKDGIVKTIGTVTGKVLSRTRSFSGNVIYQNTNVYSKLTLTNTFPSSVLVGSIESNESGPLTSIREVDNLVIDAWFPKLSQDIHFEIDKSINVDYTFGSVMSNDTSECSLINISATGVNDFYSISNVNKYSSQINDITVREVIVVAFVPKTTTTGNLNSTDIILKDIIVNPNLTTTTLSKPIVDQSFGPDGSLTVKTNIDSNTPAVINAIIDKNSGKVDISSIDIIPRNNLSDIYFDGYVINSDATIDIRICNRVTSNCSLISIPNYIESGNLFDPTSIPHPLDNGHIYFSTISTSPDGSSLVSICDILTNKCGVIRLPVNISSISNISDLNLNFKLQYGSDVYNGNVVIDTSANKLKNQAIQQVIPTPIAIVTKTDFKNITGLSTGIINKINVTIQEFDYSVLSQFSISDINLQQYQNSYKFIITDYSLQMNTQTHIFTVEIQLTDLYDTWDKNSLSWKFYFYNALTGNTSSTVESPDIILDKTSSINNVFEFKCSAKMFYGHFDMIDKTNIAFLIITR